MRAPDDPTPPSESLLTSLGGLKAEDLFARGMKAAQMTSAGAGQWQPPTLAEAARLFPQYTVTALIGRGGMGAVYRARQTTLDRDVALKLLPLEVSVNQDFAARFVREAKTMGRLSHPGVLGIYEFGKTHEGHLFIAMEFVDGTNLHDVIHTTGLAPMQSVEILCGVCDALGYAHGKGVVHRDIKPANILLGRDGKVKVADFGLARMIATAGETMTSATLTGTLMGTPDYCAPEQTRSMNVDARADLYSLGVIFYEMLCREVPRGVFDPPSTRLGLDDRVDKIIVRAMQQIPERRFQNAAEMKAALAALRTPRAATTPPAKPASAPPPKNRAPLFTAIAAVVVVLLGLAAFLLRPKSKPQAAAPTTIEPFVATPAPKAATPEPKKVVATAPAPATPVPATPMPIATATPEPMPAVTPVPAEPVLSEVAKWLAQVEASFAPAYQRDVAEPFMSAAEKLREQYLAALDAQIATLSKAQQIEAAIALRDERIRVAGGQSPHEAPLAAATSPWLKTLRDNWQKAFAKIDAERFAKAKAAHTRYDATLAQNQTALTQRQRLDDALLLKKKRDELATAWLTPPVDFSAPKAETTAPALLATGTKKDREAAELLLAAGWQPEVLSNGRPVTLTQAPLIPAGRFEFLTLDSTGNARAAITPPTDEMLAQLAPMKALTAFEMQGGEVTGTGLGFLAGSPDLARVSIDNQVLTEAALTPLLGLRHLRKLTLKGGKEFSLARLGELAALPRLETLELRVMPPGAFAPPAVLEKARSVQRLLLEGSKLTGEHFAAIATLPDLEDFNFTNCRDLPPGALAVLEKLPKLTTLTFLNTPVSAADLAIVAKCKRLESLTVDAADAAGLPSAPALRRLTVSTARPGTDAALIAIAENFPRLEMLTMRSATHGSTVAGYQALAKLTRLRHVICGSHKLDTAQVAALAAIPALEILDLNNSHVADEHLAALAAAKSLSELSLNGTPITPAAIEPLRALRGLRRLSLNNTKLSPADADVLRKALPKCTVVR